MRGLWGYSVVFSNSSVSAILRFSSHCINETLGCAITGSYFMLHNYNKSCSCNVRQFTFNTCIKFEQIAFKERVQFSMRVHVAEIRSISVQSSILAVFCCAPE